MSHRKRTRKGARTARPGRRPVGDVDDTRVAGSGAPEDGEATRVAEVPDATRVVAAPPPPPETAGERHAAGDRIGDRYEVLAVHTGSMGVVYATFDHQSGLPRALKTLRRRFEGDTTMRDLFVEEAAVWVRIEKHPFVVRAHGVEEIEHRPYVVAEYVQGREGLGPDLRSWIGHPRLTLPLAAEMALQIAQGMQHAARKVPGLVHRDLKPANVLVDQQARAMVTDFGLVRAAAAGAGTPAYLSPEQWRGEEPTPASDVYAYGCVLYEMFSGRRLSAARTIDGWRQAHLAKEPAAMRSSVPKGLQTFVRRCLAKQPRERPAAWDEVVAEAARWFHELTGQPVVLDFSAYAPDADELNTAAHSLNLLDKWNEAVAACDRALAADPGFFVAWFNKGTALHHLGRLDEALAAYDQAVGAGPEHGFIWNNRGVTLAKLGRHEEALASYDRALALDAADAIALGGRGQALMALGRDHEGMAALDQAVANDPKDPTAWFMKAMALGDTKEALAAYEKATTLKPDWVVAWRNLGALLNRLGKFEEAVAAFDHAIAIDPRRFDAVADRGFALRNLGRKEDALAACQRAVVLKPELSALWTNLGVAFTDVGRQAERLAAFERALELNKRDPEAARGRADALSQLGRHGEALPASEQALALEPRDGGGWRVRADALSRWIDSRNDAARFRSPFLAAVAEGDARTVRALLKAGLPPDTPLPDSGRSALMDAAEKGHAPVVQALVGAGATVDWRDEWLDTPLIAAAREKQQDAVRVLIEAGADVEAVNAKGETALLWSAARDCVPIAQALIAAGAAVNYRGENPLHCATPLVWAVARMGADEKDMDQGVHWAMSRTPESGGQVALLLLEAGADPNLALNSEPPLVYAAICALEPVVDRMLELGADPLKGGTGGTVLGSVDSRLTGYGETGIKDRIEARLRGAIERTRSAAALVTAARRGDLERVEELLAQGVPVNEEVDNESALRVAAKKGQVAVVRRLLAAGANVNATRATGALWWTATSALGQAAIEGHVDVVQVLLAAGADMGTASAMVGPGATPLSFAACRERQEVVEALIAAGAPVDPDALALSIEKTELRHVPAAIIEALQRHIAAQRKGRAPSASAAQIAGPCACQSMSGRPQDKEAEGIHVVSEAVHQGWSEILCVCTRCRRRWKVEEDSSYHYTTYNWSKVTQDT